MKEIRYSQKPEAVLIQHHRDYIHVDIAVNARQLEDASEHWAADSHDFWEKEGEIDLDDVRQNPQNYLCYVPSMVRAEAKQKAQLMLDKLRDACPVVPVPSYREGAAVCNRPGDKINLLAGLQMGGLAYYELASGEVVKLSASDIKAIAADVTIAETLLQQAKQQCWASIDSAQGEEGISSALADFAVVLSSYADEQFIHTMNTNTSNKVSWLAGLLSGWGIRESWAKIIAGSIAGALAAAGFLTGCSVRHDYPAFADSVRLASENSAE